MQYVPSPNIDANTLSTGAFAQTVRDDKGSFRVDASTGRLGLLTGYYFVDDYRLDNPYPGQQGGANVPGFDALTIGRAQLWSFGSAKTLGQNTVNDFHASLTHNHNDVGVPHGGTGVSTASQGFVTGPGTPGIVVLAPQFEGVENLVFNTFTMGVTITGVNQTGDTLHLSDSVSKVFGAHTLKYGGQYQFQQVRLEPNATFNGTFTFAGTETGSDFADFLLGVPSNYIQSSGGVFYLRNQYGGVFAQDSWRAKSNLTINYGVRWDIMAPWYEKDNQIQTIVPGQQSAVYPGRAARTRLPRRHRHLARPVADAIREYLAAPRLRLLAEREDERSRELRAVLHRVSGSFGRHHVRRPAVWLQLPEPGAAALRDAVHHRGRRDEQRPAVPAAVSGLWSIAEQADHQHRLVAVSPCQRRPVLWQHEQDALLGELHVLGAARAGAEHGCDGELCQHARSQHAGHQAGQPRAIRHSA